MGESDTQTFDVPPTDPAPVPVSYERVERRTFGLAPHSLVAAVAAVALGAAGALFAARHAAGGLLLLAFALLLGSLYVEQARGNRRTAVDRTTAAAVDNWRALAGFAGASLRAWSSAGRRVAQLRVEAWRLARERAGLLVELGAAAYEGNDELAEGLRGRMHALDARLEAGDVELRDVIDVARSRTSNERLAVGSTEVRRPVERRASGGVRS